MSSAPRLQIFALLLLTLGGLGIRLLGTDFCLPHIREMDSEIITQVEHFRGKPLGTRVVREYYGTYPMIIAATAWAFTSKAEADRPEAELTVAEHLRIAGDTRLDTRRTVAVLSVLLIPLTWLLARRFVGGWWALFAAAATAGSTLHVFFSHEARPHGPASAAFVLAMLAILRVRERGTVGSYALAGLALALLAGILQSALAMFIPLAVAHLLRGGGWKRLLDWKILLPPLIVAATIPATYWPLFDPALKDVDGQFEESTVTVPGHVIDLTRFNGTGIETSITAMRSYEPALSVLLFLALAIWVAARVLRWDTRRAPPHEAWIVLSFVVPYFTAISTWEENYERFVIPVLPFFAIFVAWSGRTLASRLSGGAKTAFTVLFSASLVFPAYVSARLAWIRHTPDTARQAATWLEENVDPEQHKVFVTPWWDLPLVRTQESLRAKIGGRAYHVLSDWKRYQAKRDEGDIVGPYWSIYSMVVVTEFDGKTVEGLREYLDAFGPGFYVIDAKKRGHPWMKWMSEELGARGILRRRIAPDRDPWKWNYPLFDQDGVEEDWPDLTPRVLGANSVGPVVEIYEVR